MVTCAPGTLAPLASLTVPTILPRSTWGTKLEVLATTTKVKATFKARLVTDGACMVLPLDVRDPEMDCDWFQYSSRTAKSRGTVYTRDCLYYGSDYNHSVLTIGAPPCATGTRFLRLFFSCSAR